MKARGQSQASFLRDNPPYFLRQGSSLTWNMSSRTTWLASKPQGPSCLCVPIAEVTSMSYHASSFNYNLYEWNSGLHMSKDSILPSRLPPLLPHLCLFLSPSGISFLPCIWVQLIGLPQLTGWLLASPENSTKPTSSSAKEEAQISLTEL